MGSLPLTLIVLIIILCHTATTTHGQGQECWTVPFGPAASSGSSSGSPAAAAGSGATTAAAAGATAAAAAAAAAAATTAAAAAAGATTAAAGGAAAGAAAGGAGGGYCASSLPATVSYCQNDVSDAVAAAAKIYNFVSTMTAASCVAWQTAQCAQLGGTPAGNGSTCACCNFRFLYALSNCDSDDDCYSAQGVEGLCNTFCTQMVAVLCVGYDSSKVFNYCDTLGREVTTKNDGRTLAFANVLDRNCVNPNIAPVCSSTWSSGKNNALPFEFQIMIAVVLVGATLGLCVDCGKIKKF